MKGSCQQTRRSRGGNRYELKSTSAYYGLSEEKSPERAEDHYNSNEPAARFYSRVPELSACTEDVDESLISDSSNVSLASSRSVCRSKRAGSRKHFSASPLSQKFLDLANAKSPLKVLSPSLSSRSRRVQSATFGDLSDSSDLIASSPYVNLRKQTETLPGEENTSSKKASRPRKGVFLGFSSCCKNDRDIVNENFKLKSGTKASSKEKTPVRSNEIWEKERAWNVLANIDSGTIKKKVVLKKSLTASRFDAVDSEGSLTSTSVLDRDSTCQAETLLKLELVSHPLESRLGSTLASNCATNCNYRLSTSSADASFEVDAFTWDKEHSSFTSEDSTLTYVELLKTGRQEQLPRDETFTSDSSIVSTGVREFNGKTSTLSPGCTSLPESIHQTPMKKEAARTEVLTFVTDLPIEDAVHKSYQGCRVVTRREACANENIHTNCSSSSFLNDEINLHTRPTICCEEGTVSSKEGFKDPNVHDVCGQAGCVTCTLDSQLISTRTDKKQSVRMKSVADFSETSPSFDEVVRKHNDDPSQDSSSDINRKVRESVAVVVVSNDPYNDFRESMLEMVLGKRLSKTGELEELLQYYLSLNSPCFHDVIIEVFTDVWLQLLHI